MAVSKKIKLGQAVTYVSTKGYEKLAFVTATPETVQPGHALPELPEGFAHLVVLAPNGSVSPRYSVPSEATAKDIPDFAAEGELGLRGVFRLN